jgi:plasmid stabilization system protein ParE
MEYKIIWSDSAIADLTEIVAYLARENPEAARQYGAGILEHVGLLSSFPKIGPWYPRRSQGPIREIIYKNHRIFYQVSESPKRVEIFRIHHVARDKREIPPPAD